MYIRVVLLRFSVCDISVVVIMLYASPRQVEHPVGSDEHLKINHIVSNIFLHFYQKVIRHVRVFSTIVLWLFKHSVFIL